MRHQQHNQTNAGPSGGGCRPVGSRRLPAGGRSDRTFSRTPLYQTNPRPGDGSAGMTSPEGEPSDGNIPGDPASGNSQSESQLSSSPGGASSENPFSGVP